MRKSKIVVGGLLAFLVGLGFGCKGNPEGPVVAPESGLGGSSFITNQFSSTAGSTPSLAALNSLADNNQLGDLANKNALAEVGNSNALAATADIGKKAEENGGGGLSDTGNRSAELGLVTTNQHAGESGGGAGSVSAGGNGTTLESLGSVATSPALSPSQAGNNGSGLKGLDGMNGAGRADGAGSSYASAGGSSGHGGSGSGLGSAMSGLFGLGANSDSLAGSGKGTADLEFGGGRNPASTDPNGMTAMGSRDPDNYFALLNPNDSLFKIVARRYSAKTQSWALSDASSKR